MKYAVIVIVCLTAFYCRKHVSDYFSASEKKQSVVLKELHRDREHSIHYVLMNGAEKPHYHDHHSVKTEIISGNARLHLGGQIINLKLNETVIIPAGTQHWAENLGPGYAILSAEFFPPFDGKDRRFAQ